MKKEQTLMLAELEEKNRRRLSEATLTKLELTEDVLKAIQSLQDALIEIITHGQSVKTVRLINWFTNASTEVENNLLKCRIQQQKRKDVDVRTDCYRILVLLQLECLKQGFLPTL